MKTFKYRPEVDGLRALAVLPVILFHAGFEAFSGGFVGVDVFFVISGYLITTIIISELAEGKFTITNFYERRARRILPALFLILAACLPFAWFWLPAEDLLEFGSSLVSVSVFLSNVFFWQDISYIDTDSQIKPLLHTWSLAVEEQFYILFPVFLTLTWQLGTKRIVILLVVISVISLGMATWGTRIDPRGATAFYLLPTRGWELLIGGFIAFYLHHKPYLESRGVNQFLSLLGLALLTYSIVYFDKKTPFPSLYTLIPTIGTALIILSAVPRTIVYRLLSLKIFVGIGLISYSAYLWHQPILAFARYRVLGDPPSSVLLLLCGLSLLLAWVSWRYVEAPFRNKQEYSRKSIFLISISGICAYSVIGLVVFFNNGFSTSKNGEITERLSQVGIENFEPDNGKLRQESWSILQDISGDENYGVEDNPTDKRNIFDLSSHKKRVLLVGNSHSKDVFNVLHFSNELSRRVDLDRYGIQLRDIDAEFYSSAPYKNAQAIMLSSAYFQGDLEILHELSSRILNDKKQLFIVDQVFVFHSVGSDTTADYIISKEELESGSAQPDELRRKVNSVYTNLYLQNSSTKDYLETKQAYDKVKARISADLPQIIFLNRMDYICPDNLCHGLTPEGRKTYYDRGHHTLAGVVYFAKQLPKTKFYRDFVAGLEIVE